MDTKTPKAGFSFNLSDVRRILICIAAGTLMAVNLRSFVHTGGLLPGGMAGLTVLVQEIFERFAGITIPYGRLYLLLNAFPIYLAVRKIGKKFTAYSCVTIGVVTILTEVIPAAFINVIKTDQVSGRFYIKPND